MQDNKIYWVFYQDGSCGIGQVTTNQFGEQILRVLCSAKIRKQNNPIVKIREVINLWP